MDLFQIFMFLIWFNCIQAQSGSWAYLKGQGQGKERYAIDIGIESVVNSIGGRYHHGMFFDYLSKKFFVFGGVGYGSLKSGLLNDLWTFNTLSHSWTHIYGSIIPIGLDAAGDCYQNIGSNAKFASTYDHINQNFYIWGGQRPVTSNCSSLSKPTIAAFSTDLWMYSLKSQQWTRLYSNGNYLSNPSGSFVSYVSGARPTPNSLSLMFHEQISNCLYMFGGSYSYSSTILFTSSSSYTNEELTTDLTYSREFWRFDLNSKSWTFFGGKFTGAVPVGIYGQIGIESGNNIPGGRIAHGGFYDNSYFFVFGGSGFGSIASNGIGSLNDMWRYSLTSNMWTWIGGSSDIGSNGTSDLCIIGVESANCWPGARYSFGSAFDSVNKLWYLYDTEFFRFNVLTSKWMILSTLNPAPGLWTKAFTSYSPAVYGTMNVSSPLNSPGTIQGCTMQYDTQLNVLYLFAGKAKIYYMNDVWKWYPPKSWNLLSSLQANKSSSQPPQTVLPSSCSFLLCWSSDMNTQNILIISGVGGICLLLLGICFMFVHFKLKQNSLERKLVDSANALIMNSNLEFVNMQKKNYYSLKNPESNNSLANYNSNRNSQQVPDNTRASPDRSVSSPTSGHSQRESVFESNDNNRYSQRTSVNNKGSLYNNDDIKKHLDNSQIPVSTQRPVPIINLRTATKTNESVGSPNVDNFSPVSPYSEDHSDRRLMNPDQNHDLKPVATSENHVQNHDLKPIPTSENLDFKRVPTFDAAAETLNDSSGAAYCFPAYLEVPDSNGYRHLKNLGKGGGGDVSLVEIIDSEMKARAGSGKVAMKLFKSNQYDFFHQEANIMAMFNSRYIAKIIGFQGSNGFDLKIFMIYYPLGSLKSWIQKRTDKSEQRYSLLTGFTIYYQIIQGLNIIHGNDIVHNDMKTDNVLLNEEDGQLVPKITDFGIANIVGEKTLTVHGMNVVRRKGLSTSYAAPEKLGGGFNFQAFTSKAKKADVYSCSIILYELLCVIKPWSLPGFQLALDVKQQGFDTFSSNQDVTKGRTSINHSFQS